MTSPLAALFYMREFLRQPAAVGSLGGSGARLAAAMVKAVDVNTDATIVEFGPGTGAITVELLGSGFDPSRLLLIEQNPRFADMLAKRFAGITIVQGDAWQVEEIYRARFGMQRCHGVLSGIPLLNFSADRRHELVVAASKIVDPAQGRFVQFSYGPFIPVVPPSGFYVSRSKWIFRNTPPARVWTYGRANGVMLVKPSAA
jgi:phosphatidylethanolamine/phosphatidyl-N-methylethanolamine N-methyltransferase